MPETTSPLTAHLGYWLRFVSNAVSHSFALKVEALGVTVAEWVILRELFERGDMPPSQLAEHLGLTRGAITKLADRLITKTLVIRTSRDDDRRYQTLAITEAGRDLVPALARLADQNDAQFFGHLSPEQHDALHQMLVGLARHNDLKIIPTE